MKAEESIVLQVLEEKIELHIENMIAISEPLERVTFLWLLQDLTFAHSLLSDQRWIKA